MKTLSKTVLFVYLLFLLWLVLFKFSLHIVETFNYPISGLNLIPFAGVTDSNWRDVVFNFLFFVPLGLLLSVNLKRVSFGRKLAYVFFFSLIAEVIQFIFAIGIADITDLIANTIGGLLGLIFYELSRGYFDNKKVDRHITVMTGVLVTLLFIFNLQLHQERNRPTLQAGADSSVQTARSRLTLDKNVQLAWPAVGQAAVGTVEDGVLATSSDNEKQRPTASMAKVITALAIMKKQPFDSGQGGKTYTITIEDIASMNAYIAEDGSVLPLLIGTKLTQYQAMQRILIASDNNMADILTERIFGSRQAYVSYANDMLEDMGLSQTVVADASGFSSNTVSTPSELVSIGIAALKNPVIAEIVGQQQAQIPGVGTIKNTNKLLGTNGVIGLKTGTTDEAGSCLLFAARYATKDGTEKTIVVVIMGSTNHTTLYNDSRKLLTSVQQGFGLVTAQ